MGLWADCAVIIAATFALKVFLDLLGRLLFKSVEHQSEARMARLRDELDRDTAINVEHLKAELAREASLKVEAAKAELQGAYSTLRTSVDIISAGQSGLRTEMIAVAREMWKLIVRLRLEFGDLFTFYGVLLPSEIERVFSWMMNRALYQCLRTEVPPSASSIPLIRERSNPGAWA